MCSAIAVTRADLPGKFNFTGTFESEYFHHDLGEETFELYAKPYESFENQLAFNLDWKDFFAEVRLRQMYYENAIHIKPDTREHETNFELFKFAVGYRMDKFNSYGR